MSRKTEPTKQMVVCT